MIATIGYYALFAGLGFALTQVILAIFSRHNKTYSQIIETTAFLTFWSVFTAFSALIYSFVISDFSLVNVTLNSQHATPMIYKIAGAWSSHEGSMLLWVFILTLFNLAYIFNKSKDKVIVHGVLGLIIFLFLAFVVFMSNPLVRLPTTPPQGLGLNPLLEDPLLAIHPPILYAGYLGFAICFAKAFAGVITGTIDKSWAAACRPWALLSWALMTVGLILGSIWAYYELGWGGWWFWDPVENAALIPWLSATALIHCLAVTKTQGDQRLMTICLSFTTFLFAVVGTFLVRSGMLVSVHSFASDPARGYAIFAIASVLSSLFVYALWRFKSTKSNFDFLARSGFILINNVLLIAILIIVLLGTIFPPIFDVLTHKQIAIDENYFNKAVIPFIFLLCAFMGVSHFLGWKNSKFMRLNQQISPYLIASVVVLLGFVYLYGLFAIGFAFWVIVTSFKKFKSHIPMSLSHMGFGIAILGATINAQWKSEEIVTFKVGESKNVAGQSIILKEVKIIDAPYYKRETATVEINGTIATPERRYYPLRQALTTETSITRQALSNVYIAINDYKGPNTWQLRIYYHPFIILIWLGGLISVMGALVGIGARYKYTLQISNPG